MEVLKSIVNWELWQKLQKPKKIETEIKVNTKFNLEDFFLTKDKLPVKGKDVIAFDVKGDIYNCYLSNCKEDINCTVWLDSRTHKNLNINVLIWKYDETFLWI